MNLEILVTLASLVLSFSAWLAAQKCIGKQSYTKIIKEFVGNVIPLGLLLASLLLYDYQLQRATESRLAEVEAAISAHPDADLIGVFGREKIGLVEVLPNYPTFVKAIEREVAATKTKLHVVRIQYQQSSPKGEAKYFETTKKRLKDGEISDYRRLVRAPTESHVQLYEQMLDVLRDAPTFQMKLWVGDSTPINFDLVISDESVIVVFGNGDQGPPAWAVCLKGKEMSDRFDSIFEHLWNKSDSVVLKQAKPLDDESLRAAKQLLRNPGGGIKQVNTEGGGKTLVK